jgi:hypothetical protein
VSRSAAAGMPAAAAQFRHVLGFFTVLGAVLSELTVWRDGARTTGVSALLRLIHTASCSQGLTDVLSHEDGRGGPVRLWPEHKTGASGPVWGTLRASLHLTLGSQDAAPVFMFGDWHAALYADSDPLGRLGVSGKQLLEDRHACSLPTLPETDFPARRFAESEVPRKMHGKTAARRYNSAGF